MAGSLDDLELNDDCVTHARDGAEARGCSGEHAVEIAELIEECTRQRLHIPARDGPEEDQLQQLIIGHRPRATHHEPFAQAAAVVADIGRLASLLRVGRHLGGDRLIRGEKRHGRLGEVGDS